MMVALMPDSTKQGSAHGKCESSGLCLQLTPDQGPSHHLLRSFEVSHQCHHRSAQHSELSICEPSGLPSGRCGLKQKVAKTT